MFYIIKGKEPVSLTKYKKEKFAYFDGFRNKDDIRHALLQEQGYLCAYCMRRINNSDDLTIEHYIPQSKLNRIGALNYQIMLGVCKTDRNCEFKNQTCDSHRRNCDLIINPWIQSSINEIEYEEHTGKITSKNNRIKIDLEVTLNLNCLESRLPLNRKAALDSLKSFISKQYKCGTWTTTILRKIKDYYTEKDTNGKYKEYIGILIWYLDKRLHS